MAAKRRKPMTVSEMARLGGIARARKLSAAKRKAIARKAGRAGGRAKALKHRRQRAEDSA